MTDLTDREAMASKLRANEAELNRLDAMSSLAGESFSGRIEQLEAEQVDLLLGAVAPCRELSDEAANPRLKLPCQSATFIQDATPPPD
jgi:hypothetical protein